MKLQRTSVIDGLQYTMELDVDKERVADFLSGEDKRHIQDAFPDLTPSEREFILTGITPEQWDKTFNIR